MVVAPTRLLAPGASPAFAALSARKDGPSLPWVSGARRYRGMALTRRRQTAECHPACLAKSEGEKWKKPSSPLAVSVSCLPSRVAVTAQEQPPNAAVWPPPRVCLPVRLAVRLLPPEYIRLRDRQVETRTCTVPSLLGCPRPEAAAAAEERPLPQPPPGPELIPWPCPSLPRGPSGGSQRAGTAAAGGRHGPGGECPAGALAPQNGPEEEAQGNIGTSQPSALGYPKSIHSWCCEWQTTAVSLALWKAPCDGSKPAWIQSFELLECLNERHYAARPLLSIVSLQFSSVYGPISFCWYSLNLLSLLLLIATGFFSKQITPLYVFLYLEYCKRKQDPESSWMFINKYYLSTKTCNEYSWLPLWTLALCLITNVHSLPWMLFSCLEHFIYGTFV